MNGMPNAVCKLDADPFWLLTSQQSVGNAAESLNHILQSMANYRWAPLAMGNTLPPRSLLLEPKQLKTDPCFCSRNKHWKL